MLNESVLFITNSLLGRKTISYQESLINLFKQSINEELSPEKDKVISLIKANKWDRDPQHFLDSLQKSKHPQMLTPYTIDQLKEMDTFKLPEYDIGFALKDHDGSEEGGSGYKGRVEIVAVHNNSPVKGLGKYLVEASIKNGGKVLDHFDGYLSQVYEPLGFEEYKRDAYNPEYDPEGSFKKNYGEQPVIYRRLRKE